MIFYISIFDFTRVFMSGLITVWSTVHSHSSFRGISFLLSDLDFVFICLIVVSVLFDILVFLLIVICSVI